MLQADPPTVSRQCGLSKVSGEVVQRSWAEGGPGVLPQTEEGREGQRGQKTGKSRPSP